jgi:dihydroxy-acid dehydratase
VLKQSAASPHLLKHRGQALVFDSIEEYHRAAGRDDLPVDASTVLVVRGAGPKGYPGMPEIGNFVLPRKLLERGVTDMVRVSDARMSGTGFGTVVLHVAPESAVGGPLAFARSGDWINLDTPGRTLTLEVSDDELGRRRAGWAPAPSPWPRGYARLYTEHVLQADQGADLDFLVGASGADVPRHNH